VVNTRGHLARIALSGTVALDCRPAMPKLTTQQLLELVDRERALQKELDQKYPERDYLVQLREFQHHIAYAGVGLDRAIGDVASLTADAGPANTPNRALARDGYHRARFYLFALASTPRMISEFLAKDAKKISRLSKALRKIIEKRIDDWKSHPATLLMLALRNSVQHGDLLKGVIGVEVRTGHHKKGAGFSGIYELADHVWEAAINNIRTVQQRNVVRAFYDKHFRVQADKLTRSIAAYRDEFERLVHDIETSIAAVKDPALGEQEREKIRRELGEVIRQLDEADVQDEPVRQ
jgi:hypothetical protein